MLRPLDHSIRSLVCCKNDGRYLRFKRDRSRLSSSIAFRLVQPCLGLLLTPNVYYVQCSRPEPALSSPLQEAQFIPPNVVREYLIRHLYPIRFRSKITLRTFTNNIRGHRYMLDTQFTPLPLGHHLTCPNTTESQTPRHASRPSTLVRRGRPTFSVEL